MKDQTIKFDDFEVIREIGEGNFSKILLVEHIKFKRTYAMKIIEKQKLKSVRKEHEILNEKKALNKMTKTFEILEN